MSHSLIPERSIQFSPSLAAAIGVDAAILLQHLQLLSEVNIIDASAAARDRRFCQAIETSYDRLSQQLPFWTAEAIRRSLHELCELGMAHLSAQTNSTQQAFYIAIDGIEDNSHAQNLPRETPNKRFSNDPEDARLTGASKITPQWRPDAQSLTLLAQNGVPSDFAHSLREEFILYWRERNEASHAWSSKFVQHVTRRWQSQLNDENERLNAQAGKTAAGKSTGAIIESTWSPSQDALEILARMGISANFISDAVPEFILYWQERDEPQTTWNSKFVSHAKRQWARYTNTLKHDTEPKAIESNWRPDVEVFDVLALANIRQEFALGLLAEFVMYWRDRGELHHSWNTKFLQYVKLKWSQHHLPATQNNIANTGSAATSRQNNHENNRSTTGTNKTRHRTLAEDLFDRSWAN